MDPRGWIRRKRSSDKSPGETDESSGSISGRLIADEQAYNTQVQEENEEYLSPALLKQHSKVAEEAIAGWEKAKKHASALQVQLDAALSKNLALEDRVSHLDGALEECVRQLLQEREEQSCSVENQVSELHQKLDAAEKENTSMKIELAALHKKLQVITLERDLSTQTAETASKHRLESIKKVSKLEAEVRVLKFSARKAPSPNIDHEEDKNRKLEEEKVELEKALDEFQGQVLATEEKLRATKSEIRKLQQQLLECQDQLRASQAKLNGAETELMELQTQLIEREDQAGASNDFEKERTRLVEREERELELAVAASKLEDCQKTIASLGRQLESLAAVDELLVNEQCYIEVYGESPVFRKVPSIDCR